MGAYPTTFFKIYISHDMNQGDTLKKHHQYSTAIVYHAEKMLVYKGRASCLLAL